MTRHCPHWPTLVRGGRSWLRETEGSIGHSQPACRVRASSETPLEAWQGEWWEAGPPATGRFRPG